MDRTYSVYILSSRPHGALYVGVTSTLIRRVEQHRAKRFSGLTSAYGVDRLAFFPGLGNVHDAIRFEKQLKRWRREWKVRLIAAANPRGADLYLDLVATPSLHADLAALGVACSEHNRSRSSPAAKPG